MCSIRMVYIRSDQFRAHFPIASIFRGRRLLIGLYFEHPRLTLKVSQRSDHFCSVPELQCTVSHSVLWLAIEPTLGSCVIHLNTKGFVGQFRIPDIIRPHCRLISRTETKRSCFFGIGSWPHPKKHAVRVSD